MSRLKWPFLVFLRYYRHLGLRVSLYALLSLAVAGVSPLVLDLLGGLVTGEMDFSSVLPVLTILASSMLAVSTFSLNVMVTAHRGAAAETTPRVHRILLENTTTQSVLATFIGTFVYALTSIILYHSGFYTERAAVVVMAVTILVVTLVIAAMLRWIQHLSGLGSVEESLASVTRRAADTLRTFAADPALGATEITQATVMPTRTTPLASLASGYLQLVNVQKLADCLPEGAQLYLTCKPGTHLLEGAPMAEIAGEVPDKTRRALTEAFTIGENRSYEQDAAFGLVVLSEIASRALSPGINDPGTAIAVILNLKAILWEAAQHKPDADVDRTANVFLPVPGRTDLIEAAFAPIARDGASHIEVATALRAALADLTGSGDPALAEAARAMAALALEHAKEAGLLESELAHLRALGQNRLG